MPIVAYLDPGTGALIASAAAAGVAGVGVVVKSKWRSATGRLRGHDGDTSSSIEQDAGESA